MNKSLIKFTSIFTASLMVVSSMNTFAATTVQSNVLNAVQTIQRTIFTSDGTPNGAVLVDVNTGSKFFISTGILNNTSANRVLGLDANGYVTTNVSLPSGNGTGADHDWYEIGTTTSPDNINDNKYTLGKVSIGYQYPSDSTLNVVGNVTFGHKGNRAGYGPDFSSVLGGMGNHVETIRSTIAGGYENNIVADADHSFIGGGGYNTAHAWASVIGGGEYNTINNGYATAYATIGGGRNNSIMGEMSTIGGGGYHNIANSFATIAGGYQNGVNGNFGTVGGGKNNVASAYGSTIAGGDMNSVTNLGAASSILGGVENWISNTNSAIAGGRQNIIHGATSFLGGGEQNIIEAGMMNVLGGGRLNTIKEGDWSALVGGTKNFIAGFANAIVGGSDNILRSDYSSIQGGAENTIHGAPYSSIVGGNANVMTGGAVMSFIGGGQVNIIQDSRLSVIGGGRNNIIRNSNISSILGGRENLIKGYTPQEWSNLSGPEQLAINPPFDGNGDPIFQANSIIGEYNNIRGGNNSYILGNGNSLTGSENHIVGYGNNTIGSNNKSIGEGIHVEGRNNKIFGTAVDIYGGSHYGFGAELIGSGDSNVMIGFKNSVEGFNSFAWGGNAHVVGNSIGLINVDTSTPFTGTQYNSFSINAPSGVGINTPNPNYALDVNGDIRTQSNFVAPSGNGGLTQTLNLNDNTGTPCTMTIEAGIVTSTTCP